MGPKVYLDCPRREALNEIGCPPRKSRLGRSGCASRTKATSTTIHEALYSPRGVRPHTGGRESRPSRVRNESGTTPAPFWRQAMLSLRLIVIAGIALAICERPSNAPEWSPPINIHPQTQYNDDYPGPVLVQHRASRLRRNCQMGVLGQTPGMAYQRGAYAWIQATIS